MRPAAGSWGSWALALALAGLAFGVAKADVHSLADAGSPQHWQRQLQEQQGQGQQPARPAQCSAQDTLYSDQELIYSGCGAAFEAGLFSPKELPEPGSAFQKQMLVAHNVERIRVNAARGNDELKCLKWSTELQESARGVAEACVFDHESALLKKRDPPSAGRPDPTRGENMALTRRLALRRSRTRVTNGPDKGLGGTLSTVGAFVLGQWASEGGKGDTIKNSHYYQVIAPDTTHVGCATAQCYTSGVRRLSVNLNNSEPEYSELTVCHYSPPA